MNIELLNVKYASQTVYTTHGRKYQVASDGTVTVDRVDQSFFESLGFYDTGKVYTHTFSAEISLATSGTVSLAHTLGATPKLIWVMLKCVIADGHYLSGDVLPYDPIQASAVFCADAKEFTVNIQAAGTLQIEDKDASGFLVINKDNWNLVVSALT